jgi:tetratricopeptide (TPR) repeat protein
MRLLGWFRSQRARGAAVAAMQAGRLREAAAAFESYLSANGADWEAWGYLGDCQYDLGEPDAAERALARSLQLNAECADTQETLALIYAERDRAWGRCFPMLEQCLAKTKQAGAPECTELSLAWCHHLRGDHDAAQQHFARALGAAVEEEAEKDAVVAGLEYHTGVLYHALQHDDARALAHLREAIRLSPESIYARRAQELIGRLTVRSA